MSRPVPRRAAMRGDAGFSLAELLVVLALVALIIPLGGALLSRTVQTQDSVQSMTSGSAMAQTAVASLETGIRNAADTRLGVLPNANELVVARFRDGGADDNVWKCRAWFYRAGTKTLHTRTVSSPPPSDWTLPPDDVALATSWTRLAERVVPVTGRAIFVPRADGAGLDIAFSVVETAPQRATVAPNVTITTTIVRRPQQSTGVGSC